MHKTKTQAYKQNPNFFSRIYNFFAMLIGNIFRSFNSNVNKNEINNNLAFFIFVLSVFGFVFEWFLGNTAFAKILHKFIFGLIFGRISYILPIVFFIGACIIYNKPAEKLNFKRFFAFFILFFGSICAILHLFYENPSPSGNLDKFSWAGGLLGFIFLYFPSMLPPWASVAIFILLIFLSLLILTKTPPNKIFAKIKIGLYNSFGAENANKKEVKTLIQGAPLQEAVTEELSIGDIFDADDIESSADSSAAEEDIVITDKPKTQLIDIKTAPAVKDGDASYILPDISCLKKSKPAAEDNTWVKKTTHALNDFLTQFKIDAKVIGCTLGPSVGRFEIELKPGVKVEKITSLSKNIAYQVATGDIRILSPIEGKKAIGIEIPKPKRNDVYLGDIFAGGLRFEHPLDAVIGKNIEGKFVLSNIAKMPHMLVAGSTGSGKSAFINSVIMTLILRNHPDNVKLILIDPKRVEFSNYADIPHLLAPVITDANEATGVLKWVVNYMDERYKTFSRYGLKHIEEYNIYAKENNLEVFPYLVVIVDELADLMIVGPKDTESSIARIAQLARASGIHMILATQRPSVNVMTGLIKANIPSRLAFCVTSNTDSRVILDSSGAEKLIGKGDGLFIGPGASKAVRIQGLWVSTSEITSVVEYLKTQKEPEYIDEILEFASVSNASSDSGQQNIIGKDYEDFAKAAEIVCDYNMASTSMLQRKMRIGFAKAGRLIDLLESYEIISKANGSKPRKVLISKEDLPGRLSILKEKL